MSQFRLVLGYVASWDSYLGPRVGEEVRPHMEWSLVLVFSLTTLTEFGLGNPFLWQLLHMYCTWVGCTSLTNYYLWFIWK